jgi:hypothetical protein
MRKKLLIVIIVCVIPVLLFSQEKQKVGDQHIPIGAQYSNSFEVSDIYFNRRIDTTGKGELLEVEMIVKNLTDDPMDLYVHVIATFEREEKTRSSFEMPIPEKERIRSFVPFPGDKADYQYPHPEKNDETILKKAPKNPKAGINPDTGKPYHLEDKLLIRTYHLSEYRTNYFFFNEVTILVYDSEGNPVFRQLYEIEGRRY